MSQPQRDTLASLHTTLRELLPHAVECISYNMPCFKVDSAAVAGFDGFKNPLLNAPPHSGSCVVMQFSGVPAWCTVASKGTLQFPIVRPLPKTLVR